MKRALPAVVASFLTLSLFACQSGPARRTAAAQAPAGPSGDVCQADPNEENPFSVPGDFDHPQLNGEYRLPARMLTSASPMELKKDGTPKRPYFKFEQWGLKDETFKCEKSDFLELEQRVHVIQLARAGVKDKEIKKLLEGGVDLRNLKEIVTRLNDERSHDRHPDLLDEKRLLHGFHAKSLGCMKADLKVFDHEEFVKALEAVKTAKPGMFYSGTAEELYAKMRFGVFKDATTYHAFLRYSNGNGVGPTESDGDVDVRGLAMKLLAQSNGQPLPGSDAQHPTIDFLMTNRPNPFGDTARQFMNFGFGALIGPHLFDPGNLLNFSKRDPDLEAAFRDMLSRHVETSKQARFAKLFRQIKTPGLPITSMETETFWGGSPYRLGPSAVKFQAVPRAKRQDTDKPGSTKDYMTEDLAKRLADHDIHYTFYMQLQTDVVKTPVENALVEWKEADSGLIPVGEITIFKGQDFTRKLEDGSTLLDDCTHRVFTPGHALPSHRPMGNLNRGRVFVYRASAEYRHGGAATAEPTVEEIERLYGAYPR